MEPITHEEHRAYKVAKNRFVLMLLGAISVSLLLVILSMWLYNISGAAQVDLSRPGYQSVRDKVVKEETIGQSFSSTGPVDDTALKEFRTLFDTTASKIQSTDTFAGDQLSDKALGISE